MKILMVCLGNICRSPLAEGILNHKLAAKNITNVIVHSAGTAAYHIGEGADKRTIKNAQQHQIDITQHIARQFKVSFFDIYDKIFVMDRNNYKDIAALARNQKDLQKVSLLLELSNSSILEVPDPYYGDEAAFEEVYQLLDKACEVFCNTYANNELTV